MWSSCRSLLNDLHSSSLSRSSKTEWRQLLDGFLLLFLFFLFRILWYIYEMMPLECNFLTPLPSSLWIWAVLILALRNNKDENEEEGDEEDTKDTNFSLKEPLLSHDETTDP